MLSAAHKAPAATADRARVFVLAGIVGAVGGVAVLAAPLFAEVFSSGAGTIPITRITATCEPRDAACTTAITRLNPGRFRIATAVPVRSMTIAVDAAVAARARAMLVRVRDDARFVLSRRAAGDGVTVAIPAARRTVVPLSPNAGAWEQVTVAPVHPGERLLVEEFGLLERAADFRGPPLQPLKAIPAARFYSVYAMVAVLAAAVFIAAVVSAFPDSVPRWLGPVVIAAFCWFVCILELGTTFSPYWSHDLRSVYASELESSGSSGNLTGGLYEGARIADGLGITISPGIVQWHRMPGYGLFCAGAALVGRTRDVIEIAIRVIAFQAALYSVATGLLVAAAQTVFGVPVAWLLGVLLALMPKQVAQTQPDSLVVPIAVLCLAALLRASAGERKHGQVSARAYAFTAAPFALWFLIRNDVLPGWIAVSTLLARGRWTLMFLSACVALAIALPWAAYKRQYRHEFDLMPTNTGEVLFLSLCEAPGAFPYPCTDGGYFDWASRVSQSDPTSARASTHAVVEVARHWVTYPIHAALMVWFKFRRSVFDWAWPGFQTPFNRPFIWLREHGGLLPLLTLVVLAIAVDHERRRSLILGWPLFFNLPAFLVVFASAGRFVGPASVAALIAGIPLVFERGLYSQIRQYPIRAAAVIGCAAAFAIWAGAVERFILAHDAVHYWTPLLDPRQSSLMFPGHP